MKKLFKTSIIGVGIIFCIGIFYIGHLWLTYIDDTITSGEGYGLNIGEAKEQVFGSAAKTFESEKMFILYPLDEQDFGPHREFEFTDEGYELIKDRNVWEFYYDKNYFDLLKLTFEQNKLVEIHRHRQKFELP